METNESGENMGQGLDKLQTSFTYARMTKVTAVVFVELHSKEETVNILLVVESLREQQ